MLFTFRRGLYKKVQAHARATARGLLVSALPPIPILTHLAGLWMPTRKRRAGTGRGVGVGFGRGRGIACAFLFADGGSGTLAVIRHNVPVVSPFESVPRVVTRL